MGCTQISVNGILTIPKHKPDIQSILRICTTTIIDKTITLRKKIFFAGHVDICVEYAACASDHTHPVHFLRTEIPFNGLLLHPFAREHFNTFLKTRIRLCETEITSSRTINTIMLLKLCKVKFSRIPKHSHQYSSKPNQGNSCKYSDCHCVPIQKSFCNKPHHSDDCKPPSHDHDCKPHHHDDCKPPSHDHDCKPHHHDDCKPPSHDHDCKPHHHDDCKPPSHDHDCKPHHHDDCKPPSHDHDCKPHHHDDCKPPSHNQGCEPYHIYDCKPPAHNQDYQPHHSYDNKPPSYNYDYKSYHSGYCKPQKREPVSSDDWHVPTTIHPYTRMGNSHGVAFGFNYED